MMWDALTEVSMSWAHFHLMANHLPVLGVPALLLLLAWALVRHSPAAARAALWGTVLLAPVAQLVTFSGERTEDQLEQVVRLDETLVHDHEEMAELATRGLLLTAVIAVIALWRGRRDRSQRPLPAAILVGLAASSGLLIYSAWLGGMIRHTEVHDVGAAAGRAPGVIADDRD
jgi:hypothetical protein